VTCHIDVGGTTGTLYDAEDPAWTPHEALLFRCASEIPSASHVEDAMAEQGQGAFFTQPPKPGDRLFFSVADDAALGAALAVVISTGAP
jgi:hypothetical protein